jgi:hypothetical protein
MPLLGCLHQLIVHDLTAEILQLIADATPPPDISHVEIAFEALAGATAAVIAASRDYPAARDRFTELLDAAFALKCTDHAIQ